MYTKLKLQIELFTDEVVGANSITIGYFLKLTVFEKDDRFEASDGPAGDYLRFGGFGFSIKSNKNKKFGALTDSSLVLPNLDRLGYSFIKFFKSDNERYKYVKTLYDTIKDWSNYWWGFEEDSVSKIIINENTWEVVCEKVNMKIMDKVYE